MEDLLNPFVITIVISLLGGFFGSIGTFFGWYVSSRLFSG